MRRRLLILAAIVAVLVMGAFLPWRKTVISMLLPLPVDAYPHAPSMPPLVPETSDELLAEYEQILAERAPKVLAVLQRGLTDAEIDALEAEYHFELTADLRSLYRWRNGTPRAANIDSFPDHEFIPLEQALAQRNELRQQVSASTPEQQSLHATYAGHRDKWLGLIIDLAGDGYYYHPDRSEEEGSFFFCFAEDGTYVFFPSFRNFLVAVIEGNKSGVFKFGARGAETSDFMGARALFKTYGAGNGG